jgi:cytochrome c556
MKHRGGKLMLASAALLIAVSVGSAQQTGPPTLEQQARKSVETRQGLFEVQGFTFGPVGAMLKGAPLDAALVQKEAARLRVTAGLIPEVFQLDTSKFQVTTKARATIWSNKPDFDQKAHALELAAAALEAAAQKGDRGAILDAIGKVGNACKACHEDFREK